jgi:hypothetical protein
MMLLLIDDRSSSHHDGVMHVMRHERKRGEKVWEIGTVVHPAPLRRDVDLVVDFRGVAASQACLDVCVYFIY